MKNICLSALLLTSLIACSTAPHSELPLKGSVLIIGHRGASGHRPEHTLASYELAIEMGADYIEPDLVSTKDGVLIARHENEISGTTDVAKKFPQRKTTKTIDGVSVTGWFTEDLTLKEIKTLRANERLKSRGQSHNGRYQVPTFREVLQLAQKRSLELGRVIGVYPETKHPSYFSSINLPLENRLAEELKDFGWDTFASPVFIQSFELSSLAHLRKLVGSKLVYLSESGDDLKPQDLKELSKVVHGIGPWKNLILPLDQKGRALAPTNLIKDAHTAGLFVHAYTFRSDQDILPAEYHGDPLLEYKRFFNLGIDGIFSDFPDDAVRARGQ